VRNKICFPTEEKIIDQNNVRLRHVITVVEFFGRQVLPLHVKDTAFTFSLMNQITIWGLWRLCLDVADEAAIDSFKNAPRNASYFN